MLKGFFLFWAIKLPQYKQEETEKNANELSGFIKISRFQIKKEMNSLHMVPFRPQMNHFIQYWPNIT